jgi:uncharacterized membrane protein
VVVSRAVDEEPPPGVSRALDNTFKVGLALKAADGLLEIVSGLFLLLVSPSTIDRIAHTLTAHELGQDPHDRIANYILHTTGHLSSGTTLFGAVYLLSHGVAKVVLVYFVLRGKLWAYPWLIGLLGVFIVYQLYVIALVKFSWWLVVLTAFDMFLVWLTWREYGARRAEQVHPAEAGL